jgi:hypothetical protein
VILVKRLSCNIIVPNVHAPKHDNVYDTKDIFYEELEHVFRKLGLKEAYESVR